jgi:hypothetical protein
MDENEQALLWLGGLLGVIVTLFASWIILGALGYDIVQEKELGNTEHVLQTDSTGAIIEAPEISWEINQLSPVGDTLTWITEGKPDYYSAGTAEFIDTSGQRIACKYSWIRKLK